MPFYDAGCLIALDDKNLFLAGGDEYGGNDMGSARTYIYNRDQTWTESINRASLLNEVSASRACYKHCSKWPFLGGGCEPRTSICGNVDITH